MESVDAIAQKLIPCTCGGYGENKRRHMSDCPRHSVAWEDIAAALTAERERFAAFADENGEPKSHCINCGTWWDRKERCPLCMGTHAEMVATEQAAEAAKEKTQ